MALGIAVFGLVFSAFMLYVSFLYYKRREFTLTEWGFWSVFAGLFGVVSVWPQLIDPVVVSLNLGRKLDLFIILGFMFLIAMTFYTYRIARHTEKRMEEIVRQVAIERAEKSKK